MKPWVFNTRPLTGIDIDILQILADEIGFKYKLTFAKSFNGLIRNTILGKVDLALGESLESNSRTVTSYCRD